MKWRVQLELRLCMKICKMKRWDLAGIWWLD